MLVNFREYSPFPKGITEIFMPHFPAATFFLLFPVLAFSQARETIAPVPASVAAPGGSLASPVRDTARTLNVAVNDLTTHGVDASSAAIISERLRTELLNTGKCRVMERGPKDQILQEQAFQQSGACDNSECAVEVGKLLAVDRMVAGSVGKIGEMYTLQARLLDVQTGEVLFSVSQDFEGRIEELLSRTVPRLAERLAGATGPGGA